MRRTGRSLYVLALVAAGTLSVASIAVAATISGDSSDNTIQGTDSADVLYGYAGNDTISGGSAGDRILGGDGNDRLSGTDEYQSGLDDGSKTSTDGPDRIEGENGDDTMFGASAADTLRGGPGSDIIIEGPVNDQAQDTIDADPTIFSGGPPPESSTWNDKINVASTPAAKDIVNCGPGTDEVQADNLDVVNSDCENVERVDLKPQTTAELTAADGTVAPAVVSTESEPVPPSLEGTEAEPAGPTSGASSAAYRYSNFRGWAAPAGRGMYHMKFIYPYRGDWVGLGAYQTSDARWIYTSIYSYGRHLGSAHIHKDKDSHDWIYWSGTGANGAVYGRTSCWSECWKATWWDGFVDYNKD